MKISHKLVNQFKLFLLDLNKNLLNNLIVKHKLKKNNNSLCKNLQNLILRICSFNSLLSHNNNNKIKNKVFRKRINQLKLHRDIKIKICFKFFDLFQKIKKIKFLLLFSILFKFIQFFIISELIAKLNNKIKFSFKNIYKSQTSTYDIISI